MTNDELVKRVSELEAELARVRLERDLHKQCVYDLLRGSDFDRPMTPAEIENMLHGPKSPPLEDLLTEYEKKWGLV